MKFKIKDYLKERGISVYWLEKETKIGHKTLYDMVNNKKTGVKFANLEKICRALNCTPNDLFELE